MNEFLEEFRDKLKTCLQDEPPFCQAACPFNLDIRDFITKMQRGGFNAAFRAYHNAVGFPGIVSELCHEPCKASCPRNQKDGAVSIQLLEKASMAYASRTTPNVYNLPSKGKRIAVIGAGPSGLACALRLASKKYDVTVYEKSDRIGGHLWEVMPPEVFLADFQKQFAHERYTLNLGCEVKNLRDISVNDLPFDAIYVATGENGTLFDLRRDQERPFATTTPGVFMGGSLSGRKGVEAIADGLSVASSIERYIKTGTMNEPVPEAGTKLVPQPELLTYAEPVLPADGRAYTRQEAMEEAARCVKCACDACVRYCDMVDYFGKMPKRIEEEVYVTIYPVTQDHSGTVCTRLISSCNQCANLCKNVCPQGIDLGDFLLKSLQAMHRKGAMPWAFHEFWLRDMAFANGEQAGFSRLPRGHDKSSLMFFPGCQLGASDPAYVAESYRWLLAQAPDTSLMLGCCGAPAEWAGDVNLHGEVTSKIRDNWLSLGKPKAVLACPTCKTMIDRYLPEIQSVFLYDLMAEAGIQPQLQAGGDRVSVFDPCASRGEPRVQQSVRLLVERAGLDLESLPDEGSLARCCSYGGQISIAAPGFAAAVAQKRISAGDKPYITYCANCRDTFAAQGKHVYHILDVVFGLNRDSRPTPNISERRRNRTDLKRQMLKEFWGENVAELQGKSGLMMEPDLRAKLGSQLILETDIQKVVEHCESTGQKVLDPDTGCFVGHLQIGNMTYWAVYLPRDGDGYELKNAYAHRMSIEEV